MKFVYSGEYTCFLGRTFFFGKPQDITDRATLEAIRKRPDFKEYHEKVEVEKAAKAPVLTLPSITPASDACRKCGRVVKQGRYMHERFCQG